MTTAPDIVDTVLGPPRPGQDPDRYIDGSNVLVALLAEDVLEQGPLAGGIDGRVWSYQRGVWVPDKWAVRNRAAVLMGDNYRRAHATNAEDIVLATSPMIECDPVADLVNFTNGLYDWRTGNLRPHSPEVLSTVQMTVDYDETATCPEFDKFLGDVLAADAIDMAWELIGYLMYSGNPLHKAVMLTGKGRNGKGTFLRTVEALIGKRNVSGVTLQALATNRFATATLFGKLANIAGDIDGTYVESTGTFKNITGEDMIQAEHKGRDAFEFTPWAVPVFSANKIPASADSSPGYLARWVIVNFPNSFLGREDRGLDARLQQTTELHGIAVKALTALRVLMVRGDFELGESAAAAREEFARRLSPVRTWADECCETRADLPWVYRTPLYEAYGRWCRRDGYKPLSAANFYDALEGVQHVQAARAATTKRERGFTGIKVTDRCEPSPL